MGVFGCGHLGMFSLTCGYLRETGFEELKEELCLSRESRVVSDTDILPDLRQMEAYGARQ